MKYGKEIFEELQNLQMNGIIIANHHHEIKVVSCCDWKAGACIEGINSATSIYFCSYCFCTKEDISNLKGQ